MNQFGIPTVLLVRVVLMLISPLPPLRRPWVIWGPVVPLAPVPWQFDSGALCLVSVDQSRRYTVPQSIRCLHFPLRGSVSVIFLFPCRALVWWDTQVFLMPLVRTSAPDASVTPNYLCSKASLL
jgi:hypothetical protein